MIKRMMGLVFALLLASTAFAVNGQAVVDGTNGANADAYAFGRFLNGGSTLGNWTLDSTVNATDFMNDAIVGGLSGLEYTMLNSTYASTDVNEVEFFVTPGAGYSVNRIRITQSPYSNNPGTWNGGNLEPSQFEIEWAGGGAAVLLDPSNQFSGSGGGTTFTSGSLLQFSNLAIYNDIDAWEIILPTGVSDVRLDWSSQNPTAGSDLTREWVTFDSSFTSTSPVPEPSSCLLLSIFGVSILGFFRKKRSM